MPHARGNFNQIQLIFSQMSAYYGPYVSPLTMIWNSVFGAAQGVLPDGKEVAVKRLVTRSRQGKHEFLNEVTLITSVQHRNLVKLKGCCLKRDERLLVYEFLENKSLYQALFGKSATARNDSATVCLL